MGSAYTGEDGLLHNRTLPYPTLADVERADRRQLGQWYRFCASPGLAAIGKNLKEYTIIANAEKAILTRVAERFTELGGWDSILSKEIGWTL
jgi:hypothetical protein